MLFCASICKASAPTRALLQELNLRSFVGRLIGRGRIRGANKQSGTILCRRTFADDASKQQQQQKLFKVAIVGSGPSGCYTAKYLDSALEKRGITRRCIDVLERLPTPYGLVRYGVAPDHPEVKNVQNDFDKVFEKKDTVRFLGNVNVGDDDDVTIQELRERYSAVVLAYGCQSDRKLQIPGEDLEGVMSAREFVAWYNGHPEYGHLGDQVSQKLGWGYGRTRKGPVVVIGQGNVALDCARILAKGTEGLYDTDLPTRALPVLGHGVTEISIVGRRGHVQGAFTIKELRELVKLKEEGHNTAFVVKKDELKQGTTEASLEEMNGPRGRPKTRINDLLQDAASKAKDTETKKTIYLRFLLNPIKFEGNKDEPNRLASVVCERTRLEGEPGAQKAVGTGKFETIPARLALVSIGYRAIPLPGTEQWFDEARGVLKHDHGRVDNATDTLSGLYAAGWVKRGPTGIIGTNIADAKDTVATILSDLDALEANKSSQDDDEDDSLLSLLYHRGVEVVDFDGYRNIEKDEYKHRRSDEQPREKILDVKEMLSAARDEDSDEES